MARHARGGCSVKRTLLRWHLGMGDALLCNGLVRVLVERGHHLVLPCWEKNLTAVMAMFADLDDDQATISYRAVQYADYRTSEDEEINLGHYGRHFDEHRFDESFYLQAGVPFLEKWMEFEVPFGFGHSNAAVFLHDDPKRLMNIYGLDDADTYLPEPSKPFWSHLPALMAAKEIHCINSCFAILADLIDAPGKKFLHRYARPDGGALPIFGREWTILDKPL